MKSTKVKGEANGQAKVFRQRSTAVPPRPESPLPNSTQPPSGVNPETSSEFISASEVFRRLVIIVCLLVLIISFVPSHASDIEAWSQNVKDDLSFHVDKIRAIYISGAVVSVVSAVCFGLACCFLSTTIIFFDSKVPGHLPPSPMAPSISRQRSGHTFHFNYIICMLNGAAAAMYALWWSRQKTVAI